MLQAADAAMAATKATTAVAANGWGGRGRASRERHRRQSASIPHPPAVRARPPATTSSCHVGGSGRSSTL